MRRLLFFSNNKNKVIEIRKIFNKFNLELISLYDLNISEEPKESGKTFEENAKIKSDYGFNKTGIPCFADDSGICLETFNWKPGVLSKRFLNNFKNNEACFESIIKSTKKNSKLNAYFKTSISLTIKNDQNLIFNGKIDGKISAQVKGDFGFGYDPIFIPKNHKKTLAELSTKEKNEISHRSIAVTKLLNFLTN
ncbi:RdgB/HAM1 family non-canonical purine NTP pyrophosphatase [Pelagibacteraceae bacterium]|nr:RdgB/HAM1 family non-canonical purine NTP pyrophosphatase [Pelagibacteraceae bacterium]